MIATVLCDPRFYGADCSKLCSKYTNGSQGRCNSSGILICDDHYFGFKCNIFCKNINNGTCNRYGKLVCDEHYYGGDCSRYCVNTNHGNCSAEGYLDCQEGKGQYSTCPNGLLPLHNYHCYHCIISFDSLVENLMLARLNIFTQNTKTQYFSKT